jgi:hypothetical protein
MEEVHAQILYRIGSASTIVASVQQFVGTGPPSPPSRIPIPEAVGFEVGAFVP